MLPVHLNCPPQTKREVSAPSINTFFKKNKTPFCEIPLVSESVVPIRRRSQCQEIRCLNVIQTRAEEGTGGRRMRISFLFPNPTAETDERQTWGMSVAYFHTFAYFSEKGRGSFREGEVDGVGEPRVSVPISFKS